MSKVSVARKGLVTSKKSIVAPASAARKQKKKANVIREPRVIAKESYDKHTKARHEAEQKLVAALYAEHTKQTVKPLYNAYFMKVTNRLQKIVRECLKSSALFIAAHEDADMLFRLTLTHGQKESMQTLTLFGIIQHDTHLAVFLDEEQTIQLQSEQGMNMLIAFANSASHAAESTENDLTARQQIALHQHFMMMIGQDLHDRIVYVKQNFPEHNLIDARLMKQYVLDALK